MKQININLKTAIIIAIVIISLISIIIGTMFFSNRNKIIIAKNEKTDDWKYTGQAQKYTSSIKSNLSRGFSMQESVTDAGALSMNIGFSTGGAKDVENFRENIKNGYFPISTDITYNGLFYDYTFDTGRKDISTDLFSPSYSTAIAKDPISNQNEYYMTVGLNSNIKESDFKRKKLNLVIVLDISGSMSSGFNSYYYDGKRENEEIKSKMKIAEESVNILIDQLKEDDRFGVVLFDDQAYLGKQLSLIEETDINAIKNHVLEIEPAGGTNFESGYIMGTELFKEYTNINSEEYENRIIVITDAMPNYGETSSNGLLGYVKNNAQKGIYTTFIGVGVDFNTKLIEKISNVRGANYYSVHSSVDFKERMGEQFEYMVTPLVFDLELKLNSKDFKITSVYGSDTVNKENGSLMNVNTLFPSKTASNGEVKGGVILLKLNKKNNSFKGILNLSVSYKDRGGKKYSSSQNITIDKNEEYYENTGIRKAIVLTRYANTLKNWILYERTKEERFIIKPIYGITDCIYTEEQVYQILGQHERTSVKLTVSEKFKEIFKQIKEYINKENNVIMDKNLNQEIEVLNIILD